MKTKLHNIVCYLIVVSLSLYQISPAFAKNESPVPPPLQKNINNNIQVTVYSYTKHKKYSAIEIGFTNLTDDYVEFTPKEIYLNDAVKYAVKPLSKEQVFQTAINQKSKGRYIPLAIGVGLGLAALGTSGANNGLSLGLGLAALSVGGIYLLSEGLRNSAEQNKLVDIENNPIYEIKRLPPHITLGGFLYFPAISQPKSVTVFSKTKAGKQQTLVFDLANIPASQKAKKHKLR